MRVFKKNKERPVSYIPVLTSENTEVLFIPVNKRLKKRIEKLTK